MLTFLFYQTLNQVKFRWQVLTSLPGAVVSMSVLVSKPIQVWPLWAPPTVQSETQAVVYLSDQFSKSLVCWLESEACMYSSEGYK